MSDKDSHKNMISVNTICSCIEFSGTNCVDFLNNLLISDLSSLVLDTFHYTALCNPKGRIISSFWIGIKNENHLQIICPINMQEELMNFFNMRKFRLKINIISTDDMIIIDTDGVIETTSNIEEFQSADTDTFLNILFDLNLPWIDKENSEKFIPQHVNLDQHENIMSFTKGCYPGQEIIARMKFLGKIKKRMGIIKEKIQSDLLENINTKNQVSPIINNGTGSYSVQVIEKLAE